MKRIVIILAASIILSPGCEERPKPVEPPSARFVGYYAGELFVVEKTRLEAGDSTVLLMRLDSLRHSHGVTLAERDSLLGWYRDSLPRWETFLRAVLGRLDSAKEGSVRWSGGPVIPGAGSKPGGRDSAQN